MQSFSSEPPWNDSHVFQAQLAMERDDMAKRWRSGFASNRPASNRRESEDDVDIAFSTELLWFPTGRY
jgi:hypothetical protein